MKGVALVVLGCLLSSCKRSEPAPTERKEPWLAKSPDAAAHLRAKYLVSERCEAKVELRAKEETPKGAFRVCRGELDVNLTELAASRGTLAIDVASIELRGAGDAGRNDEQSQEAQNWLDVGASRPEAERERLRWATFTITGIVEPSAPSAHAGRREKPEPEAEEPAAMPEDDAGAVQQKERRAVTLGARGQLLLHRVRVDVEVPVRVVFHYPARASADSIPERVSLTTRRPVVVSLSAHDIKPRDSAGVFQAQGMKLLGVKVGHEARVSLSATGTLTKP